MIELRKITYENFDQVIQLHVEEDQKNFVARNIYSLAEAYVSLTNQDNIPMPFAVYAHDELVGFLMLSYEEKDPDDDEDETVYLIWRFMIDKKHQRKGYGKETMIKAIEYIKTFPKGPASAIVLSYEPTNIVVKKLYASLGFIETGEMFDDEVVAKLRLE